MSPHRTLTRRSSRRPSAEREIEESFLGLAFKLHPQPEDDKDGKRDLEYAMVVNDGTGVVEGETFTTQVITSGKTREGLAEEVKRVGKEVLARVREYEEDRHVKVYLYQCFDTDRQVCMIAMAEPFPEDLAGHEGIETFATIWLHLDAIPYVSLTCLAYSISFVTTPATAIFDRLPIPSPEASAGAAISEGLKHLHPVSLDWLLLADADKQATHTATKADVDSKDHSVLVDAGGQVKLCSIVQYEQSTSPEVRSLT
jgi:hypothetical protein